MYLAAAIPPCQDCGENEINQGVQQRGNLRLGDDNIGISLTKPPSVYIVRRRFLVWYPGVILPFDGPGRRRQPAPA